MHYLRLALATAMFAAAALGPRALAEEPPHYTFDVTAPGTVQQNQLLYLAGDAMHSQWRAVLSKKRVGSSGHDVFYQWYLSVYAIDGTTYKLQYQSPRDGGPFSNVTKANGAPMWFPIQSGKIDAPIALMMEGKDNLVVETHDTHHPIAGGLYYEDQKPTAKKRATAFLAERLPKFLTWLESNLKRGGGEHLLPRGFSYVDLSAFQVVCGLQYAFPNAMARMAKRIPLLLELRARVAGRKGIARYLASVRRLPFNEEGIFRHYPELDAPAKSGPSKRAPRRRS